MRATDLYLVACVCVVYGSVNSPLARRVDDELNTAEVKLVSLCAIRRRYFNESAGLTAIKHAATVDSYNLLSLDSNLYLCVAAANCLLKYHVRTHARSWQLAGQPQTLVLMVSALVYVCMCVCVVYRNTWARCRSQLTR